MALVTHPAQVQGSYTSFPFSPSLWNRRIGLKQFASTLDMIGRTHGFVTLKSKYSLRIGAPVILRSKEKLYKISGFKGIGRIKESKTLKDPVKLSYVPQETGETLTKSSEVQNHPINYSFEAKDVIEGTPSMHSIFKSWLALLRTPPDQVSNETLKEPPLFTESRETENEMQRKRQLEIVNKVWCFFLGLNVSVKIPLLIFVPWYLIINLKYGSEVSNELIPLWVWGPLIAAVYIRMFQTLCSLYGFTIRQTVKIIRHLPTYSIDSYNYVADGKLRNDMRAKLCQPVVDIKNLDYRELSREKMKELEVWLVAKYLDFVESIWPYYCRTIRFLKRANLI